MSREFETLETLIQVYYEAKNHDWTTVALLEVVGLIDQYYEVMEATDEEFAELQAQLDGEIDRDVLPGLTIDQLYEAIHSILVHQTIPLTEEQRIAEQDQVAAEFRNGLDNFGGFKLLDVDASGNLTIKNSGGLDELFQPKTNEEEE